MSYELWKIFPKRFLGKGFAAWMRISPPVQQVIAELAVQQNFKCALCDRTKRLVIEHDHEPEYGDGGKKITIYNIRGLACQSCNWHLRKYEADEAGECFGWDHVTSYITHSEYENYIYRYRRRVRPLIEEAEIRRMGVRQYWRKKFFLDKFDEWREYGGHYPWRWGFSEIKDKKYGRIRTARQFVQTFRAIVDFAVAEKRKNPDFQLPDEFLGLVVKVDRLIGEVLLARNAAEQA